MVLLLSLLLVAAPPTPADEFGPLFSAVQTAHVFPDGKVFVDAVPRAPPTEVMKAFRAENPKSKEALHAFVVAHFELPAEVKVPPATTTHQQEDLRAHLKALWPRLTRPAFQAEPWDSKLSLPRPYVVPGGRFRELYYWDSYFTMLGLRADGETALLEAMLDDFGALLERYGRIPNGTRTYYLSRSQPPFFALMLGLSKDDTKAVQRRRLAQLRTEYAFWMKGPRVVHLPGGATLNRYWDDRATPRDESYAEDVATAKGDAHLYRELRAGAESGWDFSSRWFSDGETLATIHVTDLVPVDLNSLLLTMEDAIAQRCEALEDAACVRDFRRKSAARRAAMTKWLWAGDHFADYDVKRKRRTDAVTAATLFPLFVGAATKDQAAAVATFVSAHLLAPGGLRTTTRRTGQQWDAPNGWAPLQWVAIVGLRRYGEDALAGEVRARWLTTVRRTFDETGKMLEKYDVEEKTAGGGGEYPTQDGFGWTNGVTAALLSEE